MATKSATEQVAAEGSATDPTDPTDPTESDELRAVDGRVPGRRGLATRARLLEQTRELLYTTSYRDLKVVDIARGAGTSPATFYQYFPDAESALWALADELVGEGRERLTRPVRDGSWNGRAAYDTCERIAASFLEFWDEHRALLAVIDLAAPEGDVRFREIRLQLLVSFTAPLGVLAALLHVCAPLTTWPTSRLFWSYSGEPLDPLWMMPLSQYMRQKLVPLLL